MAAAALVAAAGGQARAQGTSLTWTGGVGNSNYSDAGNWTPGGGPPVNNGGNLFNAVIGDSLTVLLDAGTPTVLSVQDFTLGRSVFDVTPGRTFRVLDDAVLNGWVRADAGTFQSIATSTTLGAYSRFRASNGGVIRINATTWNTYVGGLSDATQSLATATGTGSQFVASSISSLTYGRAGYGRGPSDLTASLGGSINLSGLQTIQCAPGEDDVLVINLSTGGSMNLSSLQLINTTGGNGNDTVEFNLGDGTGLSLPALTTARKVRLSMGSGTSFAAPALTTLSESYLSYGAGRTITTGALTNIDNTRFAVADGASGGSIAAGTDVTVWNYWGGSYDLYTATGAGSSLNLSGIRSLVYGTNTGRDTLTIAARAGASVNLSGLQTISIIGGQDDILNIEVSGAGSTMNLSGLTTISMGGNTNDYVNFNIGAGRTLNLPALTTANRTYFTLGAGAALSAPNLTSLTQSSLTFDGTGTLTFGSVTNFDSTRIAVSNGAVAGGLSDADYIGAYYFGGNYDLFSATGTGSQLNLPGVQRIRVATNTGNNTITIAARDGGSINLSGVTNISNYNGDDDNLRFELTGTGSSINLSSLATITNNNNGRTQFSVGGGLLLNLPALTSATSLILSVAPGGTLNLPALTTATNLTLDNQPGSTLTLPALTTITGLGFTAAARGSLNAPSLTALTNSAIDLGAGQSFTTSGLSNIDRTLLRVSGGAVFGNVTATSYSNIYYYNSADYDMFTATGAGSQLNLPSIQSITYGISGYNSYFVAARNGGSVNLSGLTSISIQPGEDDALVFEQTGAGSTINLAGLTSVALTGNRYDRVVFKSATGNAFNLPSLTTANRLRFDQLSGGASFNAPNLVTLTETPIIVSPDFSLTTGVLTNINQSTIAVSNGLTYSRVGATSYNSYPMPYPFGNNFDLFTATGAGSVLNLSSLTTLNFGTDYGRSFLNIAGRNGGVVNLSGLTTITITGGQDDVLRFNSDGGTVNLNALATVDLSATGNDNSRVQFIVAPGQSMNLPALTTIGRTDIILATGSSLTAPLLASASRLNVDLAAGRTLNLPSLTSVNILGLTLGAGATLNMPALSTLQGSTLSISPAATVTTGSLTNIDNSRFLVSGGVNWGTQLAAPTYSVNYYYNNANLDLLLADGVGTVLNASGIQAINYAISGQNRFTLAARNGGTLNLSGLRSTSGANGEDDQLAFEVTGAGSSINLSSLQTINAIGNRNDSVRFVIGTGNSISVPSLTTASRLGFDLSAGATLNAPNLTTLTQSYLPIEPGKTITTGVLSNIDQTLISVVGGASYSNVSAVNVATQYFWRGNFDLYSADGAGSTLSLNSIRSLTFQTDSGRNFISIAARNGGTVNMTGLRDISTAYFYDDDTLQFSATGTGSVLRLGPLTNINGGSYYVSPSITFTASQGGRIEFGDLTLTNQTQATLADMQSSMSITRSLFFRGGVLSITPGATLDVGKHVYNFTTAEANWQLDQAIINFATPGVHYFEAAGLDLGPVNPGNNGNFGVGRIVVGGVGVPAQLQITELFDNGNRGANLREALYIYGIGQATAQDSLVLNAGSILYIDNIDVYVRENGNWIWLNSLFGPGQSVVAWGNGYLHLPSPGAGVLLGVAGLVAARRRRA